MEKKMGFSSVTAVRLLSLGALAGLINGIFGAGGGVLIVLSLWTLTEGALEDRRCVFASVTAMILPMSLASSLVYMRVAPPSVSEAIGISVCALIGGGVGAFLLGRLRLGAVKTVFSILLLVSGAIMIFG